MLQVGRRTGNYNAWKAGDVVKYFLTVIAAHARILAFHERQAQASWEYTEPDGTRLQLSGRFIADTVYELRGLPVPVGAPSVKAECD